MIGLAFSWVRGILEISGEMSGEYNSKFLEDPGLNEPMGELKAGEEEFSLASSESSSLDESDSDSLDELESEDSMLESEGVASESRMGITGNRFSRSGKRSNILTALLRCVG